MKFLVVFLMQILVVIASFGQVVGLLKKESNSYAGYTLLHPDFSKDTYLIDHDGNVVHTWPGLYTPGRTIYLLKNGLLLRSGNYPDTPFGTGGKGGYLELVDWNGNIVWSYLIANETNVHHHDNIYIESTGTIILIAWDKISVEEALANGRDPQKLGNSLWSEKIMEIKPVGTNQAEVVWEWRAIDHVIQDFDATKNNFGNVQQHPEKIDINYVSSTLPIENWLHVNALAYNEEKDQLLLSSNRLNEIWVIDHSTTITEAKGSTGGNSGKGGDLLYRWGNPVVYKQGTVSDQKLFGQHNPQWIDAGLVHENQILIYNNGAGREPLYSSVEVINPPVDLENEYLFSKTFTESFGPQEATWIYTAENKTDFYSRIISGAQRLPNNNTLICEGLKGNIFEVTLSGEITWQYVNPLNNEGIQCDTVKKISNNGVFRALRYSPEYPAFSGKTLISKGKLERTDCLVTSVAPETLTVPVFVKPNPTKDYFQFQNLTAQAELTIFTITGTIVFQQKINPDDRLQLPSGFYLYRLKTLEKKIFNGKLVIE